MSSFRQNDPDYQCRCHQQLDREVDVGLEGCAAPEESFDWQRKGHNQSSSPSTS
jgi:hypothetical protein